MNILALDLGTTTGWALRSRKIVSGTAHFKPRRFEGGGMRYLRFERWLEETHQVCGGVQAVYFEEVRRHLGVDTSLLPLLRVPSIGAIVLRSTGGL